MATLLCGLRLWARAMGTMRDGFEWYLGTGRCGAGVAGVLKPSPAALAELFYKTSDFFVSHFGTDDMLIKFFFFLSFFLSVSIGCHVLLSSPLPASPGQGKERNQASKLSERPAITACPRQFPYTSSLALWDFQQYGWLTRYTLLQARLERPGQGIVKKVAVKSIL